jgi:hypothetical protein
VTQVSRSADVFSSVEEARTGSARLALLEGVRCLDCGATYAKPREGGTVEQNPGCPNCGYVGWRELTLSQAQARELRRSAADRLQVLPVRSR